MKLIEIINVLENWAPKEHAEDFDNVGFADEFGESP